MPEPDKREVYAIVLRALRSLFDGTCCSDEFVRGCCVERVHDEIKADLDGSEREEACSGLDSSLEQSSQRQPALVSLRGTQTSTRRGEDDPCPTAIHCAVCGAEMSVLETEIGHRCKNQTSETSCFAPSADTTNMPGDASSSSIRSSRGSDAAAPPDLDAIRKAWNRLMDAREGYLRSERRCEDVRPIGEAVAALLALDVPAVVERLRHSVSEHWHWGDRMRKRAE